MSATMTMAEAVESPNKGLEPSPAGDEMPEIAFRGRAASRPSERDYEIYQRSAFELKPQSELAAEYGLSQQRVSQILRNAERWMATQPDDDEAQRMRVRVHRRWEVLFRTAMRTFHRSQQDQEIVKERTTRRAPDTAAEKAVTTTMNEKTVKQQNGDVRFLQAAMRVTERQQKLWEPQWQAAANHRNANAHAEHVEPRVDAPVSAAPAGKNPATIGHREKAPASEPCPNGFAAGGPPQGGRDLSVGKNGNHRRDVRAAPPHSVPADLLEKMANGTDERVDLSVCGDSPAAHALAKIPTRFGDVVLYNMADVVGSPGG